MAVSSYGSQTDSSGVVRILKDLDAPIEGRHVLIVEDIIDSGLTLHYLMRNLRARNPASLEVCALLTKPERLRVDLSPRYVGFEIANRFAIGYGLDHAQRYRNLDYVAALAESERAKPPWYADFFSREAFFQKRGFSDPAGGDPGVHRPAVDQSTARAPKRPPTTNWSSRQTGLIATGKDRRSLDQHQGQLARRQADATAKASPPATRRTPSRACSTSLDEAQTSKTIVHGTGGSSICSRCSPTSFPSSSSSASGSS